MIRELDIRNLAIIDHLRIDFHSGMTVLTGETGAGKSIIIDALNLLTGSRGSKTFIRTGTHQLFLQGLFTFTGASPVYHFLNHYGIDHSDGNVIIQRKIYRSGRNVCRVNGNLVNTDFLRALGKLMLDIQGQDAHQILMNSETHLHLLDAFAWGQIQPILHRYHHFYRRYRHLTELVSQRNANQHRWAQHLDMLKFQIKDIGAAHLKPHEDRALIRQRRLLRNHQAISDALKKSYSSVNGDGTYSPLDMIGEAMNAMQGVAQYGDKFHQIATSLQDVYYNLQDVSNTIADEINGQGFDQDHLNRIEARLSLIDQLKLKYGNSVDKVLQHYQEAKRQLTRLGSDQKNRGQMDEDLKRTKKQLTRIGHQLSQVRHQVAQKLEGRVHQQLTSLYMQHALFKVHFSSNGQFYANGTEKVEFYVRTNPGEKLLPLANTASGGELSRLMLAIKTIFARVQNIGTVILDEIDTGVSGRVAQAIADKIVRIAHFSQVLCITHSPQVAAMGDHHYWVWKRVSDHQTRTNLKALDPKGRINELARMLAGTRVTKSALIHAKELTKLANQAKEKH